VLVLKNKTIQKIRNKLSKGILLVEFSSDQIDCLSKLKAFLSESGINFSELDGTSHESVSIDHEPVVVLGQAGSGKTQLLKAVVDTLESAQVNSANIDYETKLKEGTRCYAILAPTNKAVSVLKLLGVQATTLHRVLYSPVYDPDYEKISDWLLGSALRPELKSFNDEKLNQIKIFYDDHPSIPGALASVGIRTSDFIQGWKRRENPLDIGIVDESSMLTDTQLQDLKKIFKVLILFGDPAQLAPVEQSGSMIFDKISSLRKISLTKIHRQVEGNPILRLANELRNSDLTFMQFDTQVRKLAQNDERIVVSSRVNPNVMCRSPVLVWRNQTRIRLIQAFRKVYNIPSATIAKGEPLICDGIELPSKHRKKRMDLEERGLIKGVQVIYLGPGKKSGFCKLYIVGANDPVVSVASIVQLEKVGKQSPEILSAASMGVVFVHGAATTIHKAQGSQWSEVQVFSPDIEASAHSGLVEAGIPLWKRLAYVAVTRAQDRLLWVTDYKLANPDTNISISDLVLPNLSMEH